MDKIDAILSSGEFAKLQGLVEGSVLEAKGLLYDLDSPEGRYELAKDVSSFANASGGHLLIGVVTRRDQVRDADVVDSFQLLSEDSFQISRYHGVIREHVYPEIHDLRVGFVRQASSAVGLGVIRVAQQHPDGKPFLICRVVEGGAYLKQIMVGYAERVTSSSEPLSPKRLQQALRRGLDTAAQHLARIDERLARLEDRDTPSERTGFDRELRDKRIDDMLRDLE